jgi:phosphoribosyl 1,2-cyclic phosphodiesterase
LFLPETALKECIPLPYLRGYVKEIALLKEHSSYSVDVFSFKTSCNLLHGVETYGFIISLKNGKTLGLMSDTAYFEGLEEEFKGVNYLILNTLRFTPKKGLLHLSVSDARRLLRAINPEVAILTHFGMTMLRANPFKIAQEMSKELGIKVLSAYDRMKVDLDK